MNTPQTKLVSLMAVASIFLAFACSDADGEDPGQQKAATIQDVDTYCQSRCTWDTRCNRNTPDCLGTCKKGARGVETRVLASFVQRVGECFKTVACDKDDFECTNQAVEAIVPNATSTDDHKKCMSTHAECTTASGTAFSDDRCIDMLMLISASRDIVSACLELPCHEINDCIQKALGR